jgi:hypothetical protein
MMSQFSEATITVTAPPAITMGTMTTMVPEGP